MPHFDEVLKKRKAEIDGLKPEFEVEESAGFSEFLDKCKGAWQKDDPSTRKLLFAYYRIVKDNPEAQAIIDTSVKGVDGDSIIDVINENDYLIGLLRDAENEKYFKYIDDYKAVLEKYNQEEKDAKAADAEAAKQSNVAQNNPDQIQQVPHAEQIKKELDDLKEKKPSAFAERVFNIMKAEQQGNADPDEYNYAVDYINSLNQKQFNLFHMYLFSVAAHKVAQEVREKEQELEQNNIVPSVIYKADEVREELAAKLVDVKSYKVYQSILDKVPAGINKGNEVKFQNNRCKRLVPEVAERFLLARDNKGKLLHRYGITVTTTPGVEPVVNIPDDIFQKSTQLQARDVDIADADIAFNKYAAYKDSLLEELTEFKAHFAFLQKDAEANFNPEAGREGSTEYRAMLTALKNCIETVKSPDSSMDAIDRAVTEMKKKTSDYCRAKEDVFNKPKGEAGLERLSTAKDLLDHTKLYNSHLNELGNSVIQSFNRFDEQVGRETSFTDMAESRKTISPDIDQKAEGKTYAKHHQAGAEKSLLIAKLNEFNRFVIKDADKYSPFQQDAKPEQLAKNYLTKKYIDMALDRNISADEVREHRKFIVSGEIEKKAKIIASNKVFKDLVKANPDGWYNEWKNIEAKSERLMNEAGDRLFENKRKYKSIETFVKKHQEGVQLSIATRAELYDNLASAVIDGMIADPANESVRIAISGKQNGLENMKAVAVSYFKNEKIFGDKGKIDSKKVEEQIRKALKNSKHKKNILTKMSDIEKSALKKNVSAKRTIKNTVKTTGISI